MRIIDDRPELWPFVLLSLLLHALLLALLWQMTPKNLVAEKMIEIYPVEEPEEGAEPYRIADIAEPELQKRPENAQFLGMYDSSVPQEMVSVTKRPLKVKVGEGRKRPQKKRSSGMRAAGKHHDRLFAFDAGLFDENRRGASNDAGEQPSASGGALDDFYPDFSRGAHTYLNVLRYPEVEYFVRLKRAFKMTFNPEPSLRDYFSRNRVMRGSVDVVLGVSVDRSGNLTELFIFRSSGIAHYDGEALRTVRASAPFSAPPEKFVRDDGMLRMTWTFSVYL